MTEHKENKTRNPKHHSVLSITLQGMASDHPETETDFKYISLCSIFYLQLLDAPRLVLVWAFWRGWGGGRLEFRSSVLVSRSRGNACHLPREEGIFYSLYIYIDFSQRNTVNMSVCYNSHFCTWNGKWVPPVWHWKSLSDAQSKSPQICICAAPGHTSSPTLLPMGRPQQAVTVGPSAGSSLWQCSISCSTVAIYGGEELSCVPLPESQASLPSGTKARMCFACHRPRQARAMRVWFGFPVKKEAASPTSGLVRSSESWFMMQIMVWRWCFVFPSAEYLGSIFS